MVPMRRPSTRAAGTMPRITQGSVDTAPSAQRRGRHRAPDARRVRLRRIILTVAAVVVVTVGAGLVLMLPARGALQEGRTGLLSARTALTEGDVAAAGRSFAEAEAAFGRASGQLGNPLTTIAGLMPILGRTPDAISNMADAGGLVARAGRELAEGTEGLRGGLGSLAPIGSVIDLRSYEQLGPPLRTARDLVIEADRLVRGSAPAWVPKLGGDPPFPPPNEL